MLFVLGIQEMRFVANWLGLMVRDLVHGQEKHRAGAAENLGCRTYGEPSLWVFFPPSHLVIKIIKCEGGAQPP